jgi:hypothetical protein
MPSSDVTDARTILRSAMAGDISSGASTAADDQDWRLKAQLHTTDIHPSLHEIVERLRGSSDLVEELKTVASQEVVITHDGKLLFAYAATQQTLTVARSAIESVLSREGVEASVSLSHWDDRHDRWEQTDPPLTPEEALAEQTEERSEEAVETRTLIAHSGRMVRAEFEQTMLESADRLGLECKLIEQHPHLLTLQVGFTVTGPKRKVDEFAQALMATGWSYVRTETNVMVSPL